ncbi:nuclear transport factor 2 family protein [Streptomyces specialis]|uniref:nuclear transport factor 2 family protein n=1 Tax=Streptomyces specialis TaxID=498367 RepID=UPI00073E211D|nr:nuclear transport factor 2 family protein [Streptomyces specialis]
MSVNYQAAVEGYFTAWNASGEALAKAVADAWTEEGTYTDPLSDVRGHEEIAGLIEAVHQQFPGFRFRPLGTVDGHHRTARFGWELVSPDGAAPVAGFDVISIAEDGRIEGVSGFLDRVPAGA